MRQTEKPAAAAMAIACAAMFTGVSAVPRQDDSSRLDANRVQCASLIYAGNKTSQCFSDQFLKRLETETTIKTEGRFRKLRLDGSDLSNFPFAVMSGEGNFRLSDKERGRLRYYLTHGGFVLASAGCSNTEWARSFRSEIARTLPGSKLKRLDKKHPLFRIIYKIDDTETVHGAGKPEGAALEAIELKGRIVLLFSQDGLNDTEHTTNCCCCGGDEVKFAEFINVNALAYALLH